MDDNRMQAIVLAQALVYASPKHSKSAVRDSSKTWNKFLDSLDWRSSDNIQVRKSPSEVKNVFTKLGIPVKEKKQR